MYSFVIFDSPDLLLQKYLILKSSSMLPSSIYVYFRTRLVAMNKTTIFMAAALAEATPLAAGITVL
jgi:hypothetical protein